MAKDLQALVAQTPEAELKIILVFWKNHERVVGRYVKVVDEDKEMIVKNIAPYFFTECT